MAESVESVNPVADACRKPPPTPQNCTVLSSCSENGYHTSLLSLYFGFKSRREHVALIIY